MIKNLNNNINCDLSADFLIVGGGTVGLPMSVKLSSASKISVICLESGDAIQDGDYHSLNKVVQLGTEYQGASKGRFRCLGGTSTRWGGALIPFLGADLCKELWPIELSDATCCLEDVESFFALNHGPYESNLIDLGSGFVTRVAKWPKFSKKNVFNNLKSIISNRSNLEVWTNATVCKIQCVTDGGVLVKARSPDGGVLNVAAKKLIIAAGAIESTRLALLLEIWNKNEQRKVNHHIGKYFADHLSLPVGKLKPINKKRLNKIFGLAFESGGVMRSLRFELSENCSSRGTVRPGFIHVGHDDSGGAFGAVRSILQALQRGSLPPIKVFKNLLCDIPWLCRFVFWRFFHKRLLFPTGSTFTVNVVTEQAPNKNNYLSLSDDRKDQFGMPLIEINWSVHSEDVSNLEELTKLFEVAWNGSSLKKLGEFHRNDQADPRFSLENPLGIYHPTGTTRMSLSEASGVVDKNLVMFNYPQIQIVSTSVLPTGGGANPTMMLMLLAFRCARQHMKGVNP